MCGICGMWFRKDVVFEKRHLLSMNGALVHRGPDDQGCYFSGSVGLAMRRLCIIDIKGGRQPMSNEDRSVWIVFNGEIYNYLELRNGLKRCGHRFATSSDTEAIIHAYEEWGESCVGHLRGMFAFAIHDRRTGTIERSGPDGCLFLARDRLGVKPLYYAQVGHTILFASELKAILSSRLVSRELNKRSLARYLQWGFVPEPETMFEGVSLLPAGHCLIIDVQDVHVKRYWPGKISPSPLKTVPEVVGRLRERLADAVRAEMVADVPVGAFLSGGLDSSAIVALMAPHAKDRLRTFSISFDEVAYNETPFMKTIAQLYGTDHHDCRVTAQDAQQNVGHFIASMDQPTIDGLNTYFVSKFTRESGIKVALSGLGGDELFGGYPSFHQLPRFAIAMRLGHSIRGLLPIARIITRRNRSDGLLRKIYEGLSTDGSIPALYAIRRGLFMSDLLSRLLTPGFRENLRLPDAVSETQFLATIPEGVHTHWGITNWLEMELYMGNQLLRDTDCMSMAHSLEVRVPFLDCQLVDYVTSLPDEFKRHGHLPKPLLKRAMEKLLPSEILQRKKATFSFPISKWMRGSLRPIVEDALCSPSDRVRQLLDAGATRKVWEEFMANRVGWTRPWGIAVLTMWLQRHLEG